MSVPSINAILQLLEQRGKEANDEDKAGIYRLRDLIVRSVHLVDRGANGRRFAVVKRGEDMPSENPGPEVIENEDGTLTTIEPVEKAGYTMDPADKAASLKSLTAAYERTASLLKKVKEAGEQSGATKPAELVTEAKAIAALVGSAAGGYPSPSAKAKKLSGEDATTEAKAKQPKDPTSAQDEMAKATAKVETHVLDLDGIKLSPEVETLAKGIVEQVEKAGRKMSGPRLEKFKSLVKGLQKMVDELQPSDQAQAEKLIEGAFGKLAKRQDQTDSLLSQMVELLKQSVGGGEGIPAGQAGTGGGTTKVEKAATDPEDRSWIGLDLNNDDLFAETADKDIYFG